MSVLLASRPNWGPGSDSSSGDEAPAPDRLLAREVLLVAARTRASARASSHSPAQDEDEDDGFWYCRIEAGAPRSSAEPPAAADAELVRDTFDAQRRWLQMVTPESEGDDTADEDASGAACTLEGRGAAGTSQWWRSTQPDEPLVVPSSVASPATPTVSEVAAPRDSTSESGGSSDEDDGDSDESEDDEASEGEGARGPGHGEWSPPYEPNYFGRPLTVDARGRLQVLDAPGALPPFGRPPTMEPSSFPGAPTTTGTAGSLDASAWPPPALPPPTPPRQAPLPNSGAATSADAWQARRAQQARAAREALHQTRPSGGGASGGAGCGTRPASAAVAAS